MERKLCRIKNLENLLKNMYDLIKIVAELKSK
jgi:hypothetical protein